MISSSIFDAFGDFLPSSWVERGVVSHAVKVKSARSKQSNANRGFDLLRFLQLGIAALAIAAPTGTTLTQTTAGQSYTRTAVTVPGSLAIKASRLFTITSAPSAFGGGVSNYTVDSPPRTYTLESKVSSTDTLSQETISVIGQNGISRLHKFSQLPVGWDKGYGDPLNVRSLNNFDAFLHGARIAPKRASVFMTHSGYVVLNWLDSAGHVTELEFRDDEIVYFDELKDQEMTLALNDVAKLKEFLLLPELTSGISI